MAKPRKPKSGRPKPSPPVAKAPAKEKKSASRRPTLIRAGATRVEVFNSGLEVWLYDDATRDVIRKKKLWQKLIDGGHTDGQVVGYGLRQDDSLRIDVVVGPPLTAAELARARWLEPQRAFLRLPSGRLAVESNDACRIGEEDPTDKGALVEAPPGNHRVTLYRVDHEALQREGLTWKGAEEVVVLTGGGAAKEDVAGLLPFKERSDLSWVGKIGIEGRTARGLVWFDDYWDTYFANLDSAVASRLGLSPGKYLRTTVPAAGMSLVTVFASDWQAGAKLPPPAGPPLPEFGFGAITTPQRWQPHEALFCRRVKTRKGITDRHKTVWLDATFEVLDLEPQGPPPRIRGQEILDTGQRGYWRAALVDRDYFDGDEHTLSMKLDARVEGVSFDEPVLLPEAIAKIDAAFADARLKPVGDFSFDLPGHDGPCEYTVRAYGGAADYFAVVWASTLSFEICLLSRTRDNKWILTGTLDEDDAQRITLARSRLSVVGTEDRPLANLVGLHRDHLKRAGGAPDAAPAGLADLVRAYDDYLNAAIG